MTLVVILSHLLIDGICGLGILALLEKKTSLGLFTIVKAIAIGMFIDTMLLGVFHFFGGSIFTGFIIFSVLSLLLFFRAVKYSVSFRWYEPLFKKRISIGEGLMLLFIGEKIVWNLLNLIRLPIYFDDTLNHWSGRGKALLYRVNWSWDPDSIYFLGGTFGHEEYPLLLSIWRATNTAFLGQPNGFSERVDGLIMALFVLITIIVWIHEETQKRWLGVAGAAILCMIPLEAWHMSAGYAEIFIQGYLILALWALMKDKYILAGIFSAALIWSKNEGLVFFVPSLILCLSARLVLMNNLSFPDKIKSFLTFNLTWLIAISPWLIFKLVYGVGFTTPTDKAIGYVDGSMSKIFDSLFNSPSSGILWIFISLALLLGAKKIISTRKLVIMTIGAFVLLGMMIFVFTSTGAYVFLENQMTIHRSLLQIAPIFIIISVLALSEKEQAPLLETE